MSDKEVFLQKLQSRHAGDRHERVGRWTGDQLERAVALLQSTDENEVFAGAQLLGEFGDHTHVNEIAAARNRWDGNTELQGYLEEVMNKIRGRTTGTDEA